jgi:hypothetical protein
MLSIRSVADLDLLEAEILEEEKNLQSLKDSLEKAELLTNRMIRTLDDFDERISELDPVIMPIFRAVQGMSQVQASTAPGQLIRPLMLAW